MSSITRHAAILLSLCDRLHGSPGRRGRSVHRPLGPDHSRRRRRLAGRHPGKRVSRRQHPLGRRQRRSRRTASSCRTTAACASFVCKRWNARTPQGKVVRTQIVPGSHHGKGRRRHASTDANPAAPGRQRHRKNGEFTGKRIPAPAGQAGPVQGQVRHADRPLRRQEPGRLETDQSERQERLVGRGRAPGQQARPAAKAATSPTATSAPWPSSRTSTSSSK